MKNKLVGIVIVALFAAGIVAAIVSGIPRINDYIEKTSKTKMGIVDFTKLIKEHRDWKRLEALDNKISMSEQKLYNAPSAMQQAGSEHMARMQKAQSEAQSELKREIEMLQADLQHQRSALESQFAEETRTLQAEMKKLQQEARKKAGQEPPAQEEIRPHGDQLKAFYRDLVTLRDRQVAAKRLELQKKAKEKMDADKARIDADLAAYETQIARANQQEKLNIQLKMQVSKDDQEIAQLKQDLSRISEEESRLKDRKKAEVAAEVEKLGAAAMGGIDKEVDAYRARIDADIKAQLSAKQGQLGGQIVRTGSPQSQSALKEYQSKAMALTQAFDARKKELESKLMGAQAESRRRLDAKRAQLEAQLKAEEKSLISDIMKSRDKMARAEQERQNRQKKDIENLHSEREKLYESMLGDIRAEASEVARKQHISMVVGVYVVNIQGMDLTEKTSARMKESKK